MDKPVKIGLIGSAPSILLAPLKNPEWQFWACSPGAWGAIAAAPPNGLGLDPMQHVHLWWEIHRYEPGQPWFSPEYCAFLAKHPKVMVAQAVPQIPNGVPVPVEDLVDEFGPYFFTSSLAWMFAMAIKHIEVAGKPAGSAIGLWGVDMSATEEYGFQRAGCQFFAMLARARGIEVGVPYESDLLRPPPLYGVSEVSHDRIKMLQRMRELQGRQAGIQQRILQAQQEAAYVAGALDDLKYIEGTWAGVIENRVYVEPPVVPALQGFVAPPAVTYTPGPVEAVGSA